MIVYGNKAGRIHRTPQAPPPAFCRRCGKPMGRGWSKGVCARCATSAHPGPAVPEGMRLCPRCRRPRPNSEFLDGKGRERKSCDRCRVAASKWKAKERESRRKDND